MTSHSLMENTKETNEDECHSVGNCSSLDDGDAPSPTKIKDMGKSGRNLMGGSNRNLAAALTSSRNIPMRNPMLPALPG